MTQRRVGRGISIAIGLAVGGITAAGVAPAQPAPTPLPAIGAASPAATPNAEAPRGYERRGRRDPFQPAEGASGSEPAVASARLKGIVRSGSPRVLIETADGIGYILKLGDSLGEARLVEIGARSVVFSLPGRRGPTAERIVLRMPGE